MSANPINEGAETSGGADTSINRWCSELIKARGTLNGYAQCMLKEEAAKSARIRKVLAAAGMEPHPQYTFSLPTEWDKCLETCQRIESAGWLLTVRVTDSTTGTLVYRVLDSDMRTVEAGLGQLRQKKAIVATVTPNRNPTVSGTLVARDGDAVVEMVYGPHHWLTKIPPAGVELQRCWFTFPHISVKYNTSETSQREMMFRHLRTVIRITLGMRLSEFAETCSSVYSEFQWDSRSGYKFFDISYSWVWTGSSGSARSG